MEEIRFLDKTGMIKACIAGMFKRKGEGKLELRSAWNLYNLDGRVTSPTPSPFIPSFRPQLLKNKGVL